MRFIKCYTNKCILSLGLPHSFDLGQIASHWIEMTKVNPKQKKTFVEEDVEEDGFNPKNIIPLNWRIPSSGQHFYKYGFSLLRNGCTHRSKLNHPLLVFVITFSITVKCVYFMFTTRQSPELRLLFGDFGWFLGLSAPMNGGIALAYCIKSRT